MTIEEYMQGMDDLNRRFFESEVARLQVRLDAATNERDRTRLLKLIEDVKPAPPRGSTRRGPADT